MPRSTSIRREPMRNDRRRSRATSCGSAMARQHSLNRGGAQSKEKKPSRNCGTASGYDWRLVKAQGLQRRPVNCGRHGQTAVALEVRKRRARVRSDQPVHLIIIITLLLERRLNVGNHLAGIEIVVAVDRLVVGVGAVVRIVAVGRIPITVIPKIVAAGEEADPGIVVSPPTAVVVLVIKPAPRLLIGEGRVRAVVVPSILPIAGPKVCAAVLRIA